MEKKNTVLLTVIAIATLLVAVVGATFAYFSADTTTNNNAEVTVTGKTAAAADVFKSEGSAEISFTATADLMQNKEADLNKRNAIYTGDKEITVSLTAGSEKATCTYDVVYVPGESAGFVPSEESQKTENASASKEFTIDATCSDTSYKGLDVDAKGTAQVLLAQGSISDTYDGDVNPQNATTQTWTFNAGLYNRAYNQDDLINKSFGGTIKIVNVVCTNQAYN